MRYYSVLDSRGVVDFAEVTAEDWDAAVLDINNEFHYISGIEYNGTVYCTVGTDEEYYLIAVPDNITEEEVYNICTDGAFAYSE